MRSGRAQRFVAIGAVALVSGIAGSVLAVAPASASVTATGFSYTVEPGTTLSVSAPGLLAGSTDTDGGTLSASFNTLPNDGTVNVNSDGSFTYTADQGYTGPDSFTYQVCDSLTFNCATGTVALTVTAPAPTVQNQSYTVRPGTTLVVGAPGVLTGASAPNGDAMTVTQEGYTSQGILSLSNTGAFNFQANSGYLGTDSFAYKACDSVTGLCSATATVVLNITAATPTIVNQNYTDAPKHSLSLGSPGVLTGATVPSGDTLQADTVSYPSSGTLTLDSDGALIYSPDSGFLGTDSFSYKACDATTGLCSSAATVNVRVGAPPVIRGLTVLRVIAHRRFTRVFFAAGDPVPRLIMRGRVPSGLRVLHRGKNRILITGIPARAGRAAFVFVAVNGFAPQARHVLRLFVRLR